MTTIEVPLELHGQRAEISVQALDNALPKPSELVQEMAERVVKQIKDSSLTKECGCASEFFYPSTLACRDCRHVHASWSQPCDKRVPTHHVVPGTLTVRLALEVSVKVAERPEEVSIEDFERALSYVQAMHPPAYFIRFERP